MKSCGFVIFLLKLCMFLIQRLTLDFISYHRAVQREKKIRKTTTTKTVYFKERGKERVTEYWKSFP